MIGGKRMIYMIRHGQTELNNAQVLQGRSDHPLNEAGIAQAETASAWFCSQGICFDAVYSSPLSRAIQTAEIVAGTQQVIPDERLIEMDYGPYEGMDLTHPAPEVLTFFQDFTHNKAPEGMESLSDVVARTGSFMDELMENASGNILISTHAIAMKGILEYLTPTSGGSYWSK